MSICEIEISQCFFVKSFISVDFLQFWWYILPSKKGGDELSDFVRIDTTANRIREAMKCAGKRQADIVRETGIDKGALSHYLKGKYEPKQDVVYKLAVALTVSEMWLWGYDCPKERPLEKTIDNSPAEMAERHFEMIMDEDLNEIFDDLKFLDARERKMVKDLAHNLRVIKTEA